jgi:hypothetical protein
MGPRGLSSGSYPELHIFVPGSSKSREATRATWLRKMFFLIGVSCLSAVSEVLSWSPMPR